MARKEYTVEQKGVGTPDYSPIKPPGQITPGPIYTLSDMGELAARLGSIVTFDRRGNIIWMDDFESGLSQWRQVGDRDAEWNGNQAKNGGFCCKLITPAVAGGSCGIERYIGFPALSPMGFEFSYSDDDTAGVPRSLWILVVLDSGSYRYTTGIFYDVMNGKLRYTSGNGSLQDIPGGAYYMSTFFPGEFDTLKFVADFTTAKYKRLLINSQTFDVSALSFQKVALESAPRMSIDIELRTNEAVAAVCYIDDAIVTLNEP